MPLWGMSHDEDATDDKDRVGWMLGGEVVRVASSIRTQVERGDPVERLTQAAAERAAPLIVVGSRGRNALQAALLGSVSAGLVRAAERPVVVAGPRSGELLGASPA